MSEWQSMRASDADRDRAADVLKAALAEGRLTYDEHRFRVDRLMRAQTYGEIQQLTVDLPTSGVPFPLTPPGQLARPTYSPPAVNPWASVQPLRRQTEGLATASLVLGIMGAFCGVTAIPAIVTGHIALSRIKETGNEGRGMAIGGMIIGYVLSIGFVLFVLTGLIWG